MKDFGDTFFLKQACSFPYNMITYTFKILTIHVGNNDE